MYQTVLTNRHYTPQTLLKEYYNSINSVADNIVANHKFATDKPINRIKFIKASKLIKLIKKNTILLNKLMNVLNS